MERCTRLFRYVQFCRRLRASIDKENQSNNDEQDTAPFTIEGSGMKEMVDIAALNSRIKFDKTDVPFDQRAILGDATETVLTRFAGRQLSPNYDAQIKNFPRVFEGMFSCNSMRVIASEWRHDQCLSIPRTNGRWSS